MASIVNYVADGSTNQFQIPFTYINQADVVVTVNGATPTFTFLNSTTINIAATPASGAKVIIKRVTPLNALVDFTDGSTLFEADLDLAHQQNRLIAEESRDRADSAIATINANIDNIDTVAGIAANVTTVAGNTTNVNSVATNMAEVLTADTNAATATTKAAEAVVSANTATAQATISTTKASESSTSAAASLASKNAAATSENNAATSETNAANSATASANSASASSSSATSASGSATTATTKAAEALTSANNAATSATNAANSATTATTKASEASASQSAAATSETNALSSKNAAATSATNAATSETNAATSETNAASSASTATTKASEASTSEINAAASQVSATASAATATTQAGIATTKATEAAASATSIGNAETTTTANAVAAANSAAAAATALDNFDDKYLGVKSSDPTVDNDGDALVQGALYFSSSSSAMQVYDGANWIAASSSGVASLTLFEYTATAGQTAFSGNDDNGLSMSFIAANLLVTMNGVILDPSDYTTTSGLTVTLDVGAAVGDVVNIYAFKSFQVADTVPATTGGTFIGPVQFNSNVTVSGTVDGVDIAAFKTSFDNLSTDIVSDTTPQLGGDLASNGNDINFADNDKAIFGASSDLQIYHDGSHSRITDAGTGSLLIDGDEVYVRSSTGENKIIADTNGGVNLFYDNASKLTTTSTGIDVTGTAVVDGLTSTGLTTVNVGAETSPLRVASTGNDAAVSYSNASTPTAYYVRAGMSDTDDFSIWTSDTKRLTVKDNGNVGIGTSSPPSYGSTFTVVQASNSSSGVVQANNTTNSVTTEIEAEGTRGAVGTRSNHDFVIKTNQTERMRIDSSGNVGIGDSNPLSILHIGTGASANVPITFAPSTGGNIEFRNTSSTGTFTITNGNGSSEKMRIDSSGNLLVGKTSANNTDVGTTIYSTLGFSSTRSGGVVGILNRTTNDGDVLLFRKDGTTVGGIATYGGGLVIGNHASSANANIRFTNNEVFPCTISGGSNNSTIDLGKSNSRFKDVYAVNYHGDGSNLTGVGGSTAYGAVGTYVWGKNSTQVNTGSTTAGSNIVATNGGGYNTNVNNYSMSGTWRIMGYNHGAYTSGSDRSLYVRIS